MSYVMRHGRRIEVDILPFPEKALKKRKKYFGARFVLLPRHWISGLGRSKSVNTYRLAHLILLAAYEDKRGKGEVTLSGKMTGYMPRSTRRRAAQELVESGLITLKGGGDTTKALRVRIVSWGSRRNE
jgi:hypothetical protein